MTLKSNKDYKNELSNDVIPATKNANSLLQCLKCVRSMGMPIHLHPFGTEQANCKENHHLPEAPKCQCL